MGILHDVIEIGLLLAMVIGVVVAYFRFRGRNFGVSDLLIFGTLSIGADILCYKLFQAVAGPHTDSAAYGALAAMLVLFGLVPVAAGVNLVAFNALLVCLARYPAVRYGTLAIGLAAWLAHQFVGNMGAMSAPGGALNSDKLAGKNWALESGASSPTECDRQSSAKAFREGCYAQLKR
jgi:hypothetical protein